MWWECTDCVAGGNDVKSMKHHADKFPDHRISVTQDAKIEDE